MSNKAYTWNQVNTALMINGMSPKQILGVLVNLRKETKESKNITWEQLDRAIPWSPARRVRIMAILNRKGK